MPQTPKFQEAFLLCANCEILVYPPSKSVEHGMQSILRWSRYGPKKGAFVASHIWATSWFSLIVLAQCKFLVGDGLTSANLAGENKLSSNQTDKINQSKYFQTIETQMVHVSSAHGSWNQPLQPYNHNYCTSLASLVLKSLCMHRISQPQGHENQYL